MVETPGLSYRTAGCVREALRGAGFRGYKPSSGFLG